MTFCFNTRLEDRGVFKTLSKHTRNERGNGGAGEKKCPDFGKIDLNMTVYDLKFSFKIAALRLSRRKCLLNYSKKPPLP